METGGAPPAPAPVFALPPIVVSAPVALPVAPGPLVDVGCPETPIPPPPGVMVESLVGVVLDALEPAALMLDDVSVVTELPVIESPEPLSPHPTSGAAQAARITRARNLAAA